MDFSLNIAGHEVLEQLVPPLGQNNVKMEVLHTIIPARRQSDFFDVSESIVVTSGSLAAPFIDPFYAAERIQSYQSLNRRQARIEPRYLPGISIYEAVIAI